MVFSRAVNKKTSELFDYFQTLGAQPVETDILQPAEILLDLYGEMIRARAYITEDPSRGEMVLRPDFTVPVVNLHMLEGAEPARYTYQGLVFRTQHADSQRHTEYLQVGYEVFDRTDPAGSDAEVFLAIKDAVNVPNAPAKFGDMGILTAAIGGLGASQDRCSALMRHVWRPERFDALLKRFSKKQSPLARAKSTAPHIGLRSQSEIELRLQALENEAKQPPIDQEKVDALLSLLSIKCSAEKAENALRKIAVTMPAILPAVDLFSTRLEALEEKGVDLSVVDYEGSYGRKSLEYYDGFVFGIYASDKPDWPPIASGGRYDALTKVLGQGRSIPAVGGVIRPELLVELEETT